MERNLDTSPSPDARPEAPNKTSVAVFKGFVDKLSGDEVKIDEDNGYDYKEAFYWLPDGRLLYVQTSEVGNTIPPDRFSKVSLLEQGPKDNSWELTKTFFEANGQITQELESQSAQEKEQVSRDLQKLSGMASDGAEDQIEDEEDFEDELPENFTPGPLSKIHQPSNLDEVNQELSYSEHDDLDRSLARSKRGQLLKRLGADAGFNDVSQHEMNELNELLQSVSPDYRTG